MRRGRALLASLLFLAAMLFPGIQASAQIQIEIQTEILSTTMTVGCFITNCGYNSNGLYGSLPSPTFNYDGAGYEIDTINLSGQNLTIALPSSQTFSTQMVSALTFHLDGNSFPLSDATISAGIAAAWDNTGLSQWNSGSTVSVRITASEDVDLKVAIKCGTPPQACGETLSVGETLSAGVSDQVATLPEGTCRWYHWNVDEGGYINKNLGDDGDDCEYTLTDEDVGEHIRAEFYPEDGSRELWSLNTLGPVEGSGTTPSPTGPPTPLLTPRPGEDEDEGEASCPEPPRTTARDVTDRETLKEFVEGSVPGIKAELEEQNELKKCYGEQGYWMHGSVYLFVITDDGTFLFDALHGELKDRELDAIAVDGEENSLWDKISEALEGDGYMEYYWDDPTTEDDNNQNPEWLSGGESPGSSRKVSYVEKFSASGEDFIIGSGIYVEEAEEEVGGPPQDVSETEEDSGGGCAVTYSDEGGTGSAATGMFFALALIWALRGRGKATKDNEAFRANCFFLQKPSGQHYTARKQGLPILKRAAWSRDRGNLSGGNIISPQGSFSRERRRTEAKRQKTGRAPRFRAYF